jgi:hypothetical protein
MPELKFIVKNANGRILFKDAGGNIIQDRPDYEAVGLTGELYPESITVGAGENTYSFVIPANGGITYTTVGGTPTSYTGNAAGLLTILSADFFNASTGSGGGGGGSATEAKQNDQLATMGAPSDSAATNPASPATQTALQKGIFANGLHSKALEQVLDRDTGIEYWRAIDFDPTTPPTAAVYIDPLTGLVTTPPANPVYPVVLTLPPNSVRQEARLTDLRGQSNFNFGQNFRYAKIVRAIHADLGIAAQVLRIDVLGDTIDLWDGQTYELPLIEYPNFYELGNLAITKDTDVIAHITFINA